MGAEESRLLPAPDGAQCGSPRSTGGGDSRRGRGRKDNARAHGHGTGSRSRNVGGPTRRYPRQPPTAVRGDGVDPAGRKTVWPNASICVPWEASVEELLVKAIGAPVEECSGRQMVDRCQGNPPFLRELVTEALGAGQLVGDGGFWHIRSEVHPTLRLVDLVASFPTTAPRLWDGRCGRARGSDEQIRQY